MPNTIIRTIDQINLDWLNQALAGTPALTSGAVNHYEAGLVDSTNAKFARIHLQYTDGAHGTLPSSLLLKMCAGGDFISTSEVHYYTHDYATLPDAPIPVCYHAGHADEPRGYHLLVEDLTATHKSMWDIPPTQEHGKAVARGLATMHALYWGEEKLRIFGAAMPGQAEVDRYLTGARKGFPFMLEAIKDDVEPAWKTALLDIFEHHPAKMIERTRESNGFTVVHGDVNSGNILAPIDGIGKTYLIDRQPFDWSLTVWLGVEDLSYMMVQWWDTDYRRAFETDVLGEYHEVLQQNGVTDYSWEQLWADYRLAAVQSVYVSANWCSDEHGLNNMRWVWFPKLQRSMQAFFDLNGADLWA